MKIFDRIKEILDKGLMSLNINDQHELTKCIDDLYQYKATNKQDIRVKEQEIKNFENGKILELKEEKDEVGKKKYTEIQIKSMISQELNAMNTELHSLQFMQDTIDGKIKATESYRIDIRDYLKPNVYIQE